MLSIECTLQIQCCARGPSRRQHSCLPENWWKGGAHRGFTEHRPRSFLLHYRLPLNAHITSVNYTYLHCRMGTRMRLQASPSPSLGWPSLKTSACPWAFSKKLPGLLELVCGAGYNIQKEMVLWECYKSAAARPSRKPIK